MDLDFIGVDSIRPFVKVSSPDLPAGANLSDGRFMWTPLWTDIGRDTIHFRFVDIRDSTVTDNVALRLDIRTVRLFWEPPDFETVIVTGQPLSMKFGSKRIAPDSLSFSFSPLPRGMTAMVPDLESQILHRYAMSVLDWTPDSTQGGLFEFLQIVTNHIPPIRSDTIRCRIRVLDDPPRNYTKTQTQYGTEVGDFSPIQVGSTWLYSYSISIRDPNSIRGIRGNYRVTVLSIDSNQNRFDIQIEKHFYVFAETAFGSGSIPIDSAAYSIRCSWTEGCVDSSTSSLPMPFLRIGNTLVHRLSVSNPTLKISLRDSSAVYIYSTPNNGQSSWITEAQYVTNTGLIYYSVWSPSMMGGQGQSVKLMEYRPGPQL